MNSYSNAYTNRVGLACLILTRTLTTDTSSILTRTLTTDTSSILIRTNHEPTDKLTPHTNPAQRMLTRTLTPHSALKHFITLLTVHNALVVPLAVGPATAEPPYMPSRCCCTRRSAHPWALPCRTPSRVSTCSPRTAQDAHRARLLVDADRSQCSSSMGQTPATYARVRPRGKILAGVHDSTLNHVSMFSVCSAVCQRLENELPSPGLSSPVNVIYVCQRLGEVINPPHCRLSNDTQS